MPDKNKKHVFVVHGRNENLRLSMFNFLRAIGLTPIEWSKAIGMTGKGSPYIGEVLDIAMNKAQAIVVLFTGDDEAKLQEVFVNKNDPEYEKILTPQARPNVLFEAGMAFGKYPERTILVQVGSLRPFSDIAGRHVVRLSDTVANRQELAKKLENAGCEIDLSGTDWHTVGDFTTISKLVQKKNGEENNKFKLPIFPSDDILKRISLKHNMEVDEIKTLIIIGTAQEYEPGTASVVTIGEILNLNPVKAEYYCSILHNPDLVTISRQGGHEGTVYKITSWGRAFLVEENLI